MSRSRVDLLTLNLARLSWRVSPVSSGERVRVRVPNIQGFWGSRPAEMRMQRRGSRLGDAVGPPLTNVGGPF